MVWIEVIIFSVVNELVKVAGFYSDIIGYIIAKPKKNPILIEEVMTSNWAAIIDKDFVLGYKIGAVFIVTVMGN